MSPGEGVELKDGDIVQFGDQSKLQVKVINALIGLISAPPIQAFCVYL